MKLMSFTKKKAVAFGLAFGVAAGAGGVAAAFFAASGTGSGSATVATATPFTVTQTTSGTASQLGPTGTVSVKFTITNTAPYAEHYAITSTDAHIVASTASGHTTTIAGSTTSNGTKVTTSTYVTGCKTAWFTPITAAPKTGKLGKNGTTTDTVTDTVTVHMTTTGSTTQAVCSSHTPWVNLSFSA